MHPNDYEKLGAFYLGREYDLATRSRRDGLLLYDAKDLVTHAVCVGMTGSGKTGLCLALLEEAAIDGVPSIIIDPKGDLSNLLLTFPDLAPADFRPWINEDDARRKGVDADTFAQQQAERWKQGLAEWGQDGARIARLRGAAEFAVYTPGSTAGLPVSVLKSFDPPPDAVIEDSEIFGERVASTVTSLLGLLGIEADPLKSREHILLSSIFGEAWSRGESLDLATLIGRVQHPPMTRVGVMEVETFFPAGDRFALAMAVNNLVASPGFSRWTEGAPLDIASMLYTSAGGPRVAIFSIAHLSDAERMFFVSLLLNQTLAWVRTCSGTTSLRALLYMDEIAGYCPPVANPPSKQPLLTLMKQARAFGFGVVVSTQNPVDLDYKGLSNAGTWFIGRLQTERDKARVLDGLEGAAAAAGGAFDRASMDEAISALGQRVFLMNNVHEDAPVVFETRWCMSYLRGPLTRQQIKVLTDASPQAPTPQSAPHASKPVAKPVTKPVANAVANAVSEPAPVVAPSGATASGAASRPVLPPDIAQYFLPARRAGAIEYRPMLLGSAKVHLSDAKTGLETDRVVVRLAPIGAGPVSVDWDAATPTDISESDVSHAPAEGARFAPVPADAGRARSYDAWKKALADSIYRTFRVELLRCDELRMLSEVDESERDFRLRVRQALREQRDRAVEKLRAKYAPKVAALRERERTALQAVEAQKAQAQQSGVQTAISVGSAVLGALLGRKAASAGTVGRAATAARGAGRTMKERSDVERAQENVEAVRARLAELEAQLAQELEDAAPAIDAMTVELEPVPVKPKKAGISVRAVVLAWAPMVGGEPAW
jgi:hypothetical protein